MRIFIFVEIDIQSYVVYKVSMSESNQEMFLNPCYHALSTPSVAECSRDYGVQLTYKF